MVGDDAEMTAPRFCLFHSDHVFLAELHGGGQPQRMLFHRQQTRYPEEVTQSDRGGRLQSIIVSPKHFIHTVLLVVGPQRILNQDCVQDK